MYGAVGSESAATTSFPFPVETLITSFDIHSVLLTFCWLSNYQDSTGREREREARSNEVSEYVGEKARPRKELAIIFSTIALVSPSRSLSEEFSGLIFVVSILGADVTT